MAEPAQRIKCTARNRSGKQCGSWAVVGTTVCRMHGGAAPQVVKAAARRLHAAQLQRTIGDTLAELEIQASEDGPTTTLLNAVHRCSAMVAVLGAIVGDLEPTRGDTEHPDGMYGPNHLGDGRPHIATTMYAEWIALAARTAKLALEAGVEERLVQLVKGQGQMVAQILQAVFDDADLALDDRQRQAARQAAARHLRELGSGS